MILENMPLFSSFVQIDGISKNKEEKLWNEGIVVVCAGGNSGRNYETIKSPGISKKIITMTIQIIIITKIISIIII